MAEAVEPILAKNNERFVLFPIQHDCVKRCRVFWKLRRVLFRQYPWKYDKSRTKYLSLGQQNSPVVCITIQSKKWLHQTCTFNVSDVVLLSVLTQVLEQFRRI